MLERGEDHATCAFALLELRMGAIAKMMRCSERLGKEEGVKLFFTTLKFALRLFNAQDRVCVPWLRLVAVVLLCISCSKEDI